MSTLKKERVIYFAGIGIFLLTMIALCLPYITVGVYESAQNAQKAQSITYLGWQLFELINPLLKEEVDANGVVSAVTRILSPRGSEAAFVIFSAILIILSAISAVLGGYGLFKNYTKGDKIGKKWINITMVGYVIFSIATLILYVLYVNYLNVADFETDSAVNATSWATFGFFSLTGVKTEMQMGPFVLVAIGLIATLTSIIFTMKIQDNSILFPYKKRHVWASIVTIVVCLIVFLLPFIDYFFSTEYLSYTENYSSIKAILFRTSGGKNTITIDGLETIAKKFTNGLGWDMLTGASGAIQGYYKVLFVIMFVVAGCGIAYAVANLLGACEVIRFNFNRKHLNTVCLILAIIGIMLWFGSFAYSLGVNVRLDDFYNQYTDVFILAYPDGEFPRTTCTLGAWLSMVPCAVGYAGVALLNAYDD